MEDLREITKTAVSNAGGGAAVAKHLHLQRQAIYQWDRVPAGHVLTVERISGVPRHKLRPDLYPDPANERQQERVNG